MTDFGFELMDEEFELDEIKEVDIPDEVQTRCKVGDIWQLGNHRLVCGDSSDSETIQTLVNGMKADMVFTDPPYGVAIGDKNRTLNEVNGGEAIDENILGDTLGADELYEMLRAAFENVRENLVVCFHGAVSKDLKRRCGAAPLYYQRHSQGDHTG